MSDDFSPEFRRELLDDFYNEADELLRALRSHLQALERQPEPAAAKEQIDALYRAMHTFKGICGIVGLQGPEELAHEAEDALRLILKRQTVPNAEALNLLERTTQRLEEIVGAHRVDAPLPETSDVLEALMSFRGAESKPISPRPRPIVDTPPPLGLSPASAAGEENQWQAVFAPTREREQRGVTVTTVRERLARLGPIALAAPVVRPDGTMVFEFNLSLPQPPSDIEAWSADGVVWRSLSGVPASAPAPGPVASPPRASTGETSHRSIAPTHMVRVDLGRLDELMRIMGEMVIHRSRLEERINHLPGDRTALQEVNHAMSRSLRELRGAITRVRLVPIDEIFTRLPLAVRDLAQEAGKQVKVVISGQETEFDKYLVERLREPLLHLVRNSVSHGVETPAERRAARKPDEATLSLRAFSAGHSVVIEIRDDGRGLDTDGIMARAAARGISLPPAPTDADLLGVICLPGFSTRDAADRAAGRGIGMSVVQTTVRELGGLLSVESTPGKSTRFTLRLPLTLSIADTFIVSAGDQTCAVPQSFIEEVIQFEEAEVRNVRQTEVIPYRDGVLPILRLSGILKTAPQTTTRVPVLVITSERGSTGLVVDRIHGQREVVVRPMSDPLLQVPGVSGATELGDGRPVLILDPATLTSGVVRPSRVESSSKSRAPAASV